MIEKPKPIIYNKSKQAIIYASISLICIAFIISSKISGYVLNENINLILCATIFISFLEAIEKFTFYVNYDYIGILFKNIYWQDITKIEIEDISKNISIYHSDRETKINFVEFLFLDAVFISITTLFIYMCILNGPINIGILITLGIIFPILAILRYILYLCYKYNLTKVWLKTMDNSEQAIFLAKKQQYKDSAKTTLSSIKEIVKMKRRWIPPKNANEIVKAIIFCAEINSFSMKQEIIKGKSLIILTNLNIKNK